MNHYKVIREITKTIEVDASNEDDASDAASDAQLDQWVSVTRAERVVMVHPVIPQLLHNQLRDLLNRHKHSLSSYEESGLVQAINFMELLERIKDGR